MERIRPSGDRNRLGPHLRDKLFNPLPVKPAHEHRGEIVRGRRDAVADGGQGLSTCIESQGDRPGHAIAAADGVDRLDSRRKNPGAVPGGGDQDWPISLAHHDPLGAALVQLSHPREDSGLIGELSAQGPFELLSVWLDQEGSCRNGLEQLRPANVEHRPGRSRGKNFSEDVLRDSRRNRSHGQDQVRRPTPSAQAWRKQASSEAESAPAFSTSSVAEPVAESIIVVHTLVGAAQSIQEVSTSQPLNSR